MSRFPDSGTTSATLKTAGMSLAFKKLLMPAVIGGGVTLTVLWHIFPMRLDTYGILDAFSYKVLDQPYLVGDLVRPAVPFDVNQGKYMPPIASPFVLTP